jgi:hypothetical protein
MKHWIDTEDGKQALLDISQLPEVSQVITQASNKHINALTARLLEQNISDATKDRQWLIARAELDGAKGLVVFLMKLINEAGKPKRQKE